MFYPTKPCGRTELCTNALTKDPHNPQLLLLATCLTAWASGPSILELGRASCLGKRLPHFHLVVVSTIAAVAGCLAIKPAAWTIMFAVSTQKRYACSCASPSSGCVAAYIILASRCLMIAYWLASLCVSIPLIRQVARNGSTPTIVVRKLYHVLAMAIFVPGVMFEQLLLAMAAAIAVAALAAIELIRIGRIPPFGESLLAGTSPCTGEAALAHLVAQLMCQVVPYMSSCACSWTAGMKGPCLFRTFLF